ncbi:MAG: serine hydrolase domain-containing protein [Gammaproteobacteria bacterium]
MKFAHFLKPLKPVHVLCLVLMAIQGTAASADEIDQLPLYDYDFSPFLQWLKSESDGQEIPGAALAIVAREGIMLLDIWGVRQARQHDPVSVDSVFRIASMSKTFAGAAATILVDQQRQSWDTRVRDLFPGMNIGNRRSSADITLRHVMSHSTGLMPHSYSNMLDDGVPYDRIKERFHLIPTVCAPGDCYGYQNVVFSLVADVVEQSTGESYARFIESQIFQPLGMTSSSVGMAGYMQAADVTAPHRRIRNGWQPTTINEAYYSVAPASGINASLYDMTMWVRANLGAFPEILSPALLADMHRPVIATPHGNYFNRWSGLERAYYAIGWRVFDYRGLRVIHHGGGVRGYRSEMAFVPAANVGMVLLFNAESNLANDVLPKFLDNLLGQL